MIKKTRGVLSIISIIMVIIINLSSLSNDGEGGLYDRLRSFPFRCFGLAQKWNMFSPNPTTMNLYTIIVGEKQNGELINLKNMEDIISFDVEIIKKIPVGHNHLSHNLGFYPAFIGLVEFQDFGEAFTTNLATYYSNKYFEEHHEKLVGFGLVQLAIETKEPGINQVKHVTYLKKYSIN